MEKEKVLVSDNHGVFLRMFKKHLNARFIVENSVLNKMSQKIIVITFLLLIIKKS
jgi:hypothetical protein